MLYLLAWCFSVYFFVYFKFYKQPVLPKKRVIFFKYVFFVFFIYFLSLILFSLICEHVFTKIEPLEWSVDIFFSSVFSLICLLGYCLVINKSVVKRIFCFDTCHLSKLPLTFFQSICILILFYPLLKITTVLTLLLLEKVFFISNLSVEQVLIRKFKAADLNLLSFFFFLFTVVIIVPCIEEFLFRGVLQSFLREKIGRISAILLSSFLFSLAHFSGLQGMGNIVILTNLFIFSICIGWFYEQIQSLTAPIFLHMLFNAFNSLLVVLST